MPWINKEDSPATCCCGCTVQTGVIIVAVLSGLNLLFAIGQVNLSLIMAELILYSPFIALAICNKSWIVRTILYVLHYIYFIFSIISIVSLVLALFLLRLPKYLCDL